MSSHDVIDNKAEKLVDHLRRMLDSTELARFAVGYFFLSGFEAIADRLSGIKELRLLIGNTSTTETIEQMAEGYRRLELVTEATERQAFRRRGEAKRMAADTAGNVRLSMEAMDQTDRAEQAVRALAQMIEEKRLKVRVYTKGRMHAKAYICDYGPVYDLFGTAKERVEKGIAVVGSSNLTLAGISHPTELNVVVHGNENHAALQRWFDELWDDAEEFDEALMRELKASWALVTVTPYELYLKTLYALVRDRLNERYPELLADTKIEAKLTDFQKRAVTEVSRMIVDHGGAFAADVVGLGKSFIGAAIVKRQERAGRRPLIICPASLVEMWQNYEEVYELNAKVVSMGLLSDETRADELLNPENGIYADRDFVLIDESHNFRSAGTNRYAAIQKFLGTGDRPVCFLTATPRNSSAWDIYHQIKLFHPDDKTNSIPIDPPDLRQYFRQVEDGQKTLPGLLMHILYRRRRNDVVRYYGLDEETNAPLTEMQFKEYKAGQRRAYVVVDGKNRFFPQRRLRTVEYSIEATYQGLYDRLRAYLGRDRRPPAAEPVLGELTYARYGLWHYVRPQKRDEEPYQSLQRSGANLRGLVRVMMFKRLESSVEAFRQTIRRMRNAHEAFSAALDANVVPAGEDAQKILYEADQYDDAELVDALEGVTGKYKLADFDASKLHAHVRHDIKMLSDLLALVEPIGPDRDVKLQELKRLLQEDLKPEEKRLIFTQYTDTAEYLYEQLGGAKQDDLTVATGKSGSKAAVVRRFAPKANPELQRRRPPGETDLGTVVATDVFSEGLNLQDCNNIINYDLHWNPVRLIQRFGRIDRIGTEHDEVYGFNFLPETGIERNLGLQQALQARIQEIHDTIGEDAHILESTERLNEEAMYAIYDAQQIPEETDPEDELVNLTDAEEMLRRLQREDPLLYERIANLPDGVRSSRQLAVAPGAAVNTFVFCEASRPSIDKGYQQLFLVDEGGHIVTRDVPRVLAAIRCEPGEPGLPLPPGHNETVTRVRRLFAEEVKHREAELKHTVRLKRGQQYVQRELRAAFAAAGDDEAGKELKGQINILERAYRSTLPETVTRELNALRRDKAAGRQLIEALKRIYAQHHLTQWQEQQAVLEEIPVVPKIVCSEALMY